MCEIWSSFVVVSLAWKELKYFVLEQRMLTHVILWGHISNSVMNFQIMCSLLERFVTQVTAKVLLIMSIILLVND